MSRPAALLCLAAAACAAGPRPTSSPDPARVTALADEYVRAYLQAFPDRADLSGLAGAPHDGLTDNSLAAVHAWDARVDGWLAELGRVDAGALWGRPEWTAHGFLREVLEAQRQARVCRDELWPVNPLWGWQAYAAMMATLQPVGDEAARAQALDRWGRLPRYIDNERANLGEGLRLGYSSPRRIVELVVAQLDEILAAPLEQSPYFDPARRAGDPAFEARWRRLLADELAPAIRRYRDYLQREYAPRARTSLAVTANPDGAACYRASFRGYTSLDRAPEEKARLGAALVARNLAEAQALGRQHLGTGDPAAMLQRLEADRANHFGSREEILADTERVLAAARQALPGWFSVVPRADAVLQPLPPQLEATGTDSYLPPSQDGSRPGVYRIKLHRPEEKLRSNSEVTAYHEVYPGHHLQLALQAEQHAHPIALLAGTSAFHEGWGRYAETLAEEMKLYRSPYALVQRRLWPGRGMVVDPGIHLQGWTREQAVAYIIAGGRWTPTEAEALIDRIAVWPGQLTAYDTGALEIFALRERARQALGDRFSLPAFHDALLSHGSVTLPMLREIIDRWIADQQRAAP